MSCHCHEHSCSGHSCCHREEESGNRMMLIRLISGSVLFLIAFLIKSDYLFIAAYMILGYDILINAVKSIKDIFNESFLMTIATIGAIIIGEFPEAAAVMLFYQIGEFLSDIAVDNSKKSISAIMDLRADTSHKLIDGKFVTVPSEIVTVGDIILVSAGEKVPLDGEIIEGEAYMDTSALTGESSFVSASVGDNVLSGSINTDSTLKIKVTKTFTESTASKILELVETEKKSNSEKFITKFAKVYTPIVVTLAVIIAILPPIFGGDFKHWFYVAMLFLVVSCPCALVVSIPLSFFSGIGCCSKNGILVKGSNALESLANVGSIAFDKTGTITEGKFKVCALRVTGIKAEALMYAAYAEYSSSHPIAKAIVEAYGKEIDVSKIKSCKEIAGNGIKAVIDGKDVLIGTKKFLDKEGIQNTQVFDSNAVYLAVNGEFVGYIVIEDIIKPEAEKAIRDLSALSVGAFMLTGDSKTNAETVAKKLNLKYFAELLPQDKVSKIKSMKKNTLTAFVGDGINDAPALAASDVGIAMGGIGSDAAIEASDIVLMSDELGKVPLSISISRKTLRIVNENIALAISIKLAVMILGVCGIATMWMAIFSDVGVCLLAIINALRAFRIKD